MNQADKREALRYPKPTPPWRGEPQLGSWYTEEEIEAAVAAIRGSMDWTGEGFGFIIREILDFEEAFAAYCGARHAVSLATASVGLDAAMACLELKPGDEVISPALNFRAAHLAVLGQGGELVLCDSDQRTLQADPADVEARLTERTRAILPVHMNGLSAPMDELIEVAERHAARIGRPVPVIGDAARSCGGGYKGGKIGKRGWMTIFSFHTMKLMTTLGEGGMVTTDDDALAERLRAMRQWGGGEEHWGSSTKLTKVQAAVGLVQLRRLDEMLAARRKVALRRSELLADIEELTLPYEPADCVHTFYLYTTLVPPAWGGEKRNRIMEITEQEYGISCVVANPPTYDNTPYIRKRTEGQRLPRAEALGSRILCVPIHPLMTEEQNAYACAAVQDAIERVREE